MNIPLTKNLTIKHPLMSIFVKLAPFLHVMVMRLDPWLKIAPAALVMHPSLSSVRVFHQQRQHAALVDTTTAQHPVGTRAPCFHSMFMVGGLRGGRAAGWGGAGAHSPGLMQSGNQLVSISMPFLGNGRAG